VLLVLHIGLLNLGWTNVLAYDISARQQKARTDDLRHTVLCTRFSRCVDVDEWRHSPDKQTIFAWCRRRSVEYPLETDGPFSASRQRRYDHVVWCECDHVVCRFSAKHVGRISCYSDVTTWRRQTGTGSELWHGWRQRQNGSGARQMSDITSSTASRCQWCECNV